MVKTPPSKLRYVSLRSISKNHIGNGTRSRSDISVLLISSGAYLSLITDWKWNMPLMFKILCMFVP